MSKHPGLKTALQIYEDTRHYEKMRDEIQKLNGELQDAINRNAKLIKHNKVIEDENELLRKILCPECTKTFNIQNFNRKSKY